MCIEQEAGCNAGTFGTQEIYITNSLKYSKTMRKGDLLPLLFTLYLRKTERYLYNIMAPKQHS